MPKRKHSKNDMYAGTDEVWNTEEFVPRTPSAKANPYVSEEEQGMELEARVVGPPAYASPDPATTAGRLRPLTDHPLAASLSEDYGQLGDSPAAAPSVDSVLPVKAGEPETGAGDDEEGYNSLTVEELKDVAREREIEGFSTMKKAELVQALRESDENENEDNS
jgi:hypothetical protein